MIVGVRTWALIVGSGCVLAAGLGAYAAQPSPTRKCNESVAILRPVAGAINCNPGEAMETTPLANGLFLVRCKCPAPTAPESR